MYKIMAVMTAALAVMVSFIFGMVSYHFPAIMFAILITTVAYHMATLPEV